MNFILTCPDDVLEKIMSYISFDEVSRCRLVCRRFNFVGQRVLNHGFHKVEKYHAQCLKKVKQQLPRRESERRKHHLSRHCDILTAVETRLSLLGMTFMKYIDLNYCCFIPGKVLDEIYKVLRYVTTESSPVRAHEVLTELRDLSSMAMEYFDEKISPSFKKLREPVPKIVTGMNFRSRMQNSTLTLTAEEMNYHNDIAIPDMPPHNPKIIEGVPITDAIKFQKIYYFIHQLVGKLNVMHKEQSSLTSKFTEFTKRFIEAQKEIVEHRRVNEMQSQKLKNHEVQINNIHKRFDKEVRPATNPSANNNQDPCCSYTVKQEPIDDDVIILDVQDPCCSRSLSNCGPPPAKKACPSSSEGASFGQSSNNKDKSLITPKANRLSAVSVKEEPVDDESILAGRENEDMDIDLIPISSIKKEPFSRKRRGQRKALGIIIGANKPATRSEDLKNRLRATKINIKIKKQN